MNANVPTSPASGAGWQRPTPTADFLAKHTPEAVEDWRSLTERVVVAATEAGFSKAEVIRRAQMKEGTFHQWFAGNYVGRLEPYNRQMANWLDAFEDAAGLAGSIPQSPGYLTTRIGREITETLHWAQQTADMVMITAGAGMGKTAACRRFASTRPHVFHATVSPHTKTVHGMLVELAAELDVREHNPAKLTRAIGAKLARIGGGTLLIVDEAQNLVDDAINQLRHFMDIYQCGIALVGNEEVYTRFGRANGGPSYAQLKRRIGKRVKRSTPYAEDVRAFIVDGWGITDEDCISFLVGVGAKGGALGQIDKTCKLAHMLVKPGEPVALKHLQAAWNNRDVEDMQ